MMDSPVAINMIALYYCYKKIPEELLESYYSAQTSTCTDLCLKGRIRLSPEGINGVLSGRADYLKLYEDELRSLLFPGRPDNHDNTELSLQYGQTLDVKYCSLREDIPIESQLFDSLQIHITKDVVTLVETQMHLHRRKRNNKARQKPLEKLPFDQYAPSPHLTPQEWNQRLLLSASTKNTDVQSDSDSILVDARNVYESSIGHFKVQGIPTLLTNTRKYSDLTEIIEASMTLFSGKNVYFYCTGGVRCERATSYLQALVENQWPQELMKPKSIYQLQGGIQKYLESYGMMPTLQNNELSQTSLPLESNIGPCLYAGKNFVFDPRRTDPVAGPCSVVGRCIACDQLHDDYDNGNAPCDNKEARCCNCRILILVCNSCRKNVRAWGEAGNKPSIFCGKNGTVCAGLVNKVDNITIVES